MCSFVKMYLFGAVAAVCLTSSSGARSDDSHLVDIDVHEDHESSVNTSAVGANLGETCYFKDPQCPPGAYKGHSRINGDYCQCHGKVAMIADQGAINDDSTGLAGQAKAFAAQAHATARCVVTNDFQNYWFKLKKDGSVPEENSMCVCSGISGSECLSTTVALTVTTSKPVQSKLTCDEMVVWKGGTRGDNGKVTPSTKTTTQKCKIDDGNFCRYDRHDHNDCITDTQCGPISQRCVDTSTSVIESQIKGILANSIGSRDMKGMAEIARIVGNLASTSVSETNFDPDGWKQLLENQKKQIEWLSR